MADDFLYTESVSAPGRHQWRIVPSDTADLPSLAKSVVVLSPGDVTLIAVGDPDSGAELWPDLPKGWVIPIVTRRVMATGTTSTHLKAIG